MQSPILLNKEKKKIYSFIICINNLQIKPFTYLKLKTGIRAILARGTCNFEILLALDNEKVFDITTQWPGEQKMAIRSITVKIISKVHLYFRQSLKFVLISNQQCDLDP